MTMIETILADFGHRNGLEELAFDDNGVCRLVLDDVFDIDIELDGSEVSFFAVLGSMDGVGPGMLRRMMGANLTGDKTGEATLAIDEMSESVMLCRRLPADGLSYPAFERALEGFFEGFQRWRQKLGDQKLEDDLALDYTPPGAVDPTMTMLRI